MSTHLDIRGHVRTSALARLSGRDAGGTGAHRIVSIMGRGYGIVQDTPWLFNKMAGRESSLSTFLPYTRDTSRERHYRVRRGWDKMGPRDIRPPLPAPPPPSCITLAAPQTTPAYQKCVRRF
ncbi:hypothetical protein EVAR_20205_1 [Eumeta japonica]|uniref:Uncharacterized protein n=1 Tax=Eumeta variegata TaxID=151549 RepID=A0A4C1UTW4_EUMVA|nr:hypothetical protein EVAR_20205_1 [Eumeta japonica]